MPEPSRLDRTFSIIIERMIATGKAPSHTDIAAELGVPPEQGRSALRKLILGFGFPGWFTPKTDNIETFAPFSVVPTRHRVTIGGEQKWFAQCAFESLAICWLFPGRTVRVDSVCPDCGEPVRVEVKDGKIEVEEPKGLIGHVSIPLRRWIFNWPYT